MEHLNVINYCNSSTKIYGIAHLNRLIISLRDNINFIFRKLIEILENLHEKLLPSLSPNNNAKRLQETCIYLENHITCIEAYKKYQEKTISILQKPDSTEVEIEDFNKHIHIQSLHCKMKYQNLTLHVPHTEAILSSLSKNEFARNIITHIKTFQDNNVTFVALIKYFRSQIDLCASLNKILELEIEKKYLDYQCRAINEHIIERNDVRHAAFTSLCNFHPDIIRFSTNLYYSTPQELLNKIIVSLEKINPKNIGYTSIVEFIERLDLGISKCMLTPKIMKEDMNLGIQLALKMLSAQYSIRSYQDIVKKMQKKRAVKTYQLSNEYKNSDRLAEDVFSLNITKSQLEKALKEEAGDALKTYKDKRSSLLSMFRSTLVIYFKTFVCVIINKITNLLSYLQKTSFLVNKDSIIEDLAIANIEHSDTEYDNISLLQFLMQCKDHSKAIQKDQKDLLYSLQNIENPSDPLNPSNLTLLNNSSNNDNASDQFIKKNKDYKKKYDDLKIATNDLLRLLKTATEQNVLEIMQELKMVTSTENSQQTLENYIKIEMQIYETRDALLGERLLQKDLYKQHRCTAYTILTSSVKQDNSNQLLMYCSPALFLLINSLPCSQVDKVRSVLSQVFELGSIKSISTEQKITQAIKTLKEIEELGIPFNTLLHIIDLSESGEDMNDVLRAMNTFIELGPRIDVTKKSAILNDLNASASRMQTLQNRLQAYKNIRDATFSE